ncbi:MAG TPA: NepR family anti-sigma factor [Rhizomicrobium sp.]|nr:NepR family anti-sigma factor [Rhizomicrobium sp.]
MADKMREGAMMEQAVLTAGASDRPKETPGRRVSKPQTHRAQQRAITQGLRRFFDSVASEPVPDEFMALLQKIDGKKDTDA